MFELIMIIAYLSYYFPYKISMKCIYSNYTKIVKIYNKNFTIKNMIIKNIAVIHLLKYSSSYKKYLNFLLFLNIILEIKYLMHAPI